MTNIARRTAQLPDGSLRSPRRRSWRLRNLGVMLISASAATSITMPVSARADAVAYLVNVTVRPGYGFANAEAALAYGHSVCDRIRSGMPYGSLVSEIKQHFHTSDDYQGAYLINQAANELCPGAIWQLRNSAVGYRVGSE